MTEPPRQMSLPFAPNMTRSAFVVDGSNEDALVFLDEWAKSSEPTLVVYGPSGSGKSHLLSILADEWAGPAVFDPGDAGAGALLIVEDADHLEDPGVILRAIDQCRRSNGRVAIAGRGDPYLWARGLVDLETRLAAAPRLVLSDPTEALMQRVLQKLFSDRQIVVTEAFCAYACALLPRTFKAAARFVEAMETELGAGSGRLSKALASRVIATLSVEVEN
ncbi:MAG: hypothetical protein AAF850_10275 [Pseudomonadota bacterium]